MSKLMILIHLLNNISIFLNDNFPFYLHGWCEFPSINTEIPI